MVNLQTRIDAAVECNVAPDEYFSVWDELGEWQLDALKKIGLKPSHKLIDFGCGALRLGLLAIDYLDSHNYFGLDAFEPYLNVGKKLVDASGIKKSYFLEHSKRFEFEKFGADFDYGIAQSVFTHMSGQECTECMVMLKRVMRKNSLFLFTYLIGEPATRGMLYLGAQPMRRFAMRDPVFFADLAKSHGVAYQRLNVQHITNQEVALFKF